MSETAAPAIKPGEALHDATGHRIGTVDAVYVDYVLVRTSALLPVDLYVPIVETAVGGDGIAHVATSRSEAIERWHRPLKRAPHAE